MNSTLNQSKQSFLAIGLVNEFDLTHESCEIKIKDKNGEDAGTKDTERIRGKISIRFNNCVKVFDVFCTRLTNKGEESKQWKNAESWLELTPEINSSITTNFGKEEKNIVSGDNDNASLVSVSGRLMENRYYNTNTKAAAVNLRWNATRVSTSKVTTDATQGCTLSGNFYIKSIAPETNNDEETGRLKVCLVAVDYGANPILIDAIVAEDLADAFEDIYEVGQTASFDMDVIFEHVGATVSKEKAFGKSGTIKSTGYDKELLVITGGDEPIEESEEEDDEGNPVDNGYINPKAMKMALKERETMLTEITQNGGNANKVKSGTSSGLKAKKKLGNKKTTTHPLDDDENPFDDEDDDF